ncbi:interleukin-6 receptor subunit beta-like [Sceloporus undulatus]|uniref:interleukin-6 receptor subunit beta-like n=1 Tax=Sceloporus undulatus TaxID=8520 RepID=UPI001C4D6C83|nr:interleukin-6 receptor subunit beta-like [Sceloporus undulatus]
MEQSGLLSNLHLTQALNFCELHGFFVQENIQGDITFFLDDDFPVLDPPECDYSMCMLHPDWQDDLMCYYEEDEGFLYCSWLMLPQTSVFTVVFKWNRICEMLVTTLSSIERSRQYFHPKANLTVWVASSYSNESCITTKKMSFIPNKTKKCPSPSVIRAYQLFNKIIIAWKSPSNILQYELQFKEATQANSNWTLVPIVNGAFNATVSSVKSSSSYVARLRCLPKSESCSICVWSEQISIPHKLTEKPTILENTVKEISQGKISVFLKWKVFLITMLLPVVVGSSVSTDKEIQPYDTFLQGLCDQKAHLPGQINVSNHQNRSVISWDLKYTPNYIVIDWGTGIEDMDLEIISGRMKKKTLGHLQPYKLYKVMLHAFYGRCEDFMKYERTFGMAYFYAVEGVPRTGPTNVTILAVTKHSALVKWTEIPAEECLGFLQAYQISYAEILENVSSTVIVKSSAKQYLLTELKAKTVYRVHISGVTSKGEGAQSRPRHFTTLKYDEGEFERILAGLCLGIILTMLFVVMVYSLVFKRSRKVCWPVVPNPRYSSATQNMEGTFPVALLGPGLQQLVSSQPCNGEKIIYVEESHSLIRHGSPSMYKATRKGSAKHFEVVGMEKLDANLIPLKKTDEINISKKGKGTIHCDYVGLDVSHRAMQFSKVIHHLPSNPGRGTEPAAYSPQSLVKPSQEVMRPEKPSPENRLKLDQNLLS